LAKSGRVCITASKPLITVRDSSEATGKRLLQDWTENFCKTSMLSAETPITVAPRAVNWSIASANAWASIEPLVHTGYARYRERLLALGADLYELSPQRTTASTRFGRFGMSLGRLHSKTAAIDRRTIFVGSMNLDPRAATQNTEMGVVVDSPQLARELLRVINISKLQNSYRLRLATGTRKIEWLTTDGEREMVLTDEPESGFLQKLYNRLLAPFVPEMLL
jgi:cardiolipin synthase C